MLFNIAAGYAAQTAADTGIPVLFDENESPNEVPQDDEGGIINKIKGWITGAVGGIWKFVKGLFKGDWSMSNLVRKAAGWLVSTSSYIMNFNWNISPKQIEEQIKGSFTGIADLVGEAVGGSLGWAACGVGSSALVGVINPKAAAIAFDRVNEEGMEEIRSYFGAVGNALFRVAAQGVFLFSYASARRVVLKFFGQDERLAQIEAGKAKPWTINQALENWIEGFEDKGWWGQLLAGALESGLDELKDACSEAFMIVADSFADSLALAEGEDQRRNPYRLVEVSYRDDELDN